MNVYWSIRKGGLACMQGLHDGKDEQYQTTCCVFQKSFQIRCGKCTVK